MGELEAKFNQLTSAVSQAFLSCQTQSPSPRSLVSRSIKFSGKAFRCKGFLLQCPLYFVGQMSIMDQQKIAQFLNLITDNALRWVTAIWEKGEESLCSYERFLEMFGRVFDHAPEGKEIRGQLLAIKQGRTHAADYTLEFCTLTHGSGWNDGRCSLNWHVRMIKQSLTHSLTWRSVWTISFITALHITCQLCPPTQWIIPNPCK